MPPSSCRCEKREAEGQHSLRRARTSITDPLCGAWASFCEDTSHFYDESKGRVRPNQGGKDFQRFNWPLAAQMHRFVSLTSIKWQRIFPMSLLFTAATSSEHSCASAMKSSQLPPSDCFITVGKMLSWGNIKYKTGLAHKNPLQWNHEYT